VIVMRYLHCCVSVPLGAMANTLAAAERISALLSTDAAVIAAAACVQVVRQLLGVLLSLLDRLAGLQLAMGPPSISGRFTGGGCALPRSCAMVLVVPVEWLAATGLGHQ
jgi:hypothetical protein